MMQVSRLARRGLVVSLAMVAGATVVATPAASGKSPREPFTRTVEPADPANPPSAPPAVDLTAACVRRVRGGFEAVFGYDSRASASVLVSLEPDWPEQNVEDPNVILRTTKAGPTRAVEVEDLGPQVTLFKPGSHPYAFAVQFTPHERVAWQVEVPAQDGVGAWRVTVRPRMGASCRRDVPDHFAVVQHVDVAAPGIGRVAVRPPFQIVAYQVVFGIGDIRATCGTGGELLEPEVFVGWPAAINLEPIEPDYVVEITSDGGSYEFQMTPPMARWVIDVFQRVEWLGPIADVTARCAFGDEIVDSDVFWAEQAGSGFLGLRIEDGVVVGFEAGQSAPLGSRLR